MPRKKVSKSIVTKSRDPRVAIYLRVSTSYQIDKDSLPMQRQDLIAYCQLILGTDQYDVFEDAGYSGKNMDRPAFQEMMRRVRAGEFTHILVWKIDRISRNLLDFAGMYEELQSLRVTFVSKNEQFDTSTAIGEAMLKIILVFAELERNMTSERVTATMISRASNGQWNGGRVPFGYNYDPESSTFSIREDEASVCRILKDHYINGKSLTQTARFLNEKGFKTRAGVDWTPTAVWIIASSPFYAGIYRYNRYTGTEDRTENPEEEWVMVPDHHPAIFTLEEHEAMSSIRSDNNRQFNAIGKSRTAKNIHIFSGIAYCGKCDKRMISNPGKPHSKDGYRPSNYTCPIKRKSSECDNPAVNDVVIGEFVINYILNMLNAKKSFSQISDTTALQKQLLSGSTFYEIDRIEEDGLNEFFNLLSRYKSDSSFTLSMGKPKKKKVSVNPQLAALRAEKEKQERALSRLQDLYLYSEDSITEKDFILRKANIVTRLEQINKELGLISKPDSILSDEEFVKQASHLLIQRELNGKTYIYYRDLAASVSPDILQIYMHTILEKVCLLDGRISSITFKNGLTHTFIYNTDAPRNRRYF